MFLNHVYIIYSFNYIWRIIKKFQEVSLSDYIRQPLTWASYPWPSYDLYRQSARQLHHGVLHGVMVTTWIYHLQLGGIWSRDLPMDCNCTATVTSAVTRVLAMGIRMGLRPEWMFNDFQVASRELSLFLIVFRLASILMYFVHRDANGQSSIVGTSFWPGHTIDSELRMLRSSQSSDSRKGSVVFWTWAMPKHPNPFDKQRSYAQRLGPWAPLALFLIARSMWLGTCIGHTNWGSLWKFVTSCHIANWKMIIEIVDFPIYKWWFSRFSAAISYVSHYQRLSDDALTFARFRWRPLETAGRSTSPRRPAYDAWPWARPARPSATGLIVDGWRLISGWWLTYPPEKYESQLGWLFPIYGKIKNVPNHQPVDIVWQKLGKTKKIWAIHWGTNCSCRLICRMM